MTQAERGTLPARIERACERGGQITFVTGGKPDAVSWARLHDDARGMAAAMQARGVVPGDHVALLSTTSRQLVTAIQACWLAGAAAVVLPLPMRLGSIEEFVDKTRALVRSADVKLLAVAADLAAFVEPAPGDPPFVDLEALVAPPSAFSAPVIDPESLAILQFTSGSTSDPKGVMLPHRVVVNNLDGVAAAAQLDVDTDVLVSWLPLYHDMGLIGLLGLSMINGNEMVLGAPQDFLARPLSWMEWLSEFEGTATAGPNFSYALAARALKRASGLDLSHLRVALNGAEPVDADTVASFLDAGAPFGLRPGAMFPAFGMAEVAIGGTFPEPMSGIRLDVVSRKHLEHDRYAAPAGEWDTDTRRLALLGRALPGLEIRVCDPETGAVLDDRMVGELEIRGNSVTPGYYKRPEATAATFRGGWLRTGDLGYLVDGELVLCGRIKDVIIVGGRNVYPEDVERAAAGVEGVRPGNVIAFGVDGEKAKEGVVVVAEIKADDHHAVRRGVIERVRAAVGLPPKDVVLVQPGTLPKTSSGKLQRSLCRTKYLAETLALAAAT